MEVLSMEVLSEDEDDETIAAIDRGIEDADEGRSVSLDEARELLFSAASPQVEPRASAIGAVRSWAP